MDGNDVRDSDLALAGLAAKQQRALRALIGGAGPTEAARAARVDRSTLFRWRRSETFSRALDFELAALRERAGRSVEALVPVAVKSLRRGLTSDPRLALRLLAELGVLAGRRIQATVEIREEARGIVLVLPENARDRGMEVSNGEGDGAA